MTDDDDFADEVVSVVGGRLVLRKKWCDCPKPGFGLVKVAEGRWGRPCCLRPVNREQAKKWQRQDNERSQCERDKEE